MMLYLIASLLIGLLLTCDVFILAHPYVPRRVYAILVLSISAFFLVQAYFTFYPLVVVTLGVHSVLLVKSTGKHYMFFYLPIGYILNCVFGNLVGLAFNLLWNLSVKELNADAAWIVLHFIGTGIVSFPALYLVRRLFLRYLGDILEGMGKKLLAFLALTLLLCAYMILTMASFFDTIEITHREYFLMVASLVLYFLFTFSMLFIVLHAVRGNYEARKKVEYLEHLKEYTGNLEMVYDNLRSFRHDYINVMASLAAYIEEGRYEELREFFYGHILPMQKGLTQKNDALNSLLHVEVLELKSILYTKLLLAVNREVEVEVDIPDVIDCVHMDPVDLVRVLGIYLDNAIEACLETERPFLGFHLGRVEEGIVFLLSNPFVDRGLSLGQMCKKDVSTKGEGRGIGLYTVGEILNRYDNVYHETRMEEGVFIQQVRICRA
nr:GHKL domain-containing protein [uncultured Acetatifactor sp.]